MRKRVAIFANGWGYEYLMTVIGGVYECAKKENIDIFTFINYSVQGGNTADNKGEFNIFTLPRLEDFDGVLLMANSFNNPLEVEYLHKKMLEAKLPVISLEYELEGLDFLGTENYLGMYDLAEHLIEVHGVQNILLIGGPQGHEESDTRLRAVKDAADKHGIFIPEENVLYGNWADSAARGELEKWLSTGNSLPDAIVCANDNMAMGVCGWLDEHGYSVPEDVKVGSFDFLEEGQNFFPALTSVNRYWEKMGYQGLQLLLKKIAGEEIPKQTIVRSHLECGESCGCKISPKKAKLRLKAGRDVYSKRIAGMLQDSHYRSLYQIMRRCSTAQELHQGLSDFLGTRPSLEGEDFMLCLEPNFFTTQEELRTDGYSEQVDAVYAVEKGMISPLVRIDFRQELFRRIDACGEPRCYVVIALHDEEKSMGYALFTTGISIVDNYVLYRWNRYMNQCLGQVRQNAVIKQLTESLRQLSVTDVLTGVYNRVGCEDMIYPFLEECQRKGDNGALMLVDVDRMKQINDKYGHLQGDLALRTVAGMLQSVLPKHWIIARYGGDEFLAAGRCQDTKTLEEFKAAMTERLAKEALENHLTFELTISVGGVTTQEEKDFTLEQYLRKADERMYEEKREHHKRKGV